MAQFTLNDILSDIAATIDQDTTLATGTDLLVRVNLVNQTLREWSRAYQPKELRIAGYKPSISLSMTSLGLPANFKKLMSRPWDMSKTTGNDYEEVRPEEFYMKTAIDVNNRFCYIGGDDAVGKYLYINPALPSGASLMFDYAIYPSSMATLQDVCVCPSKSFMVNRVLGKIYFARADPRFQVAKGYADDALADMMEEEAAPSGGMTNKTRNQFDSQNFRLGQDG